MRNSSCSRVMIFLRTRFSRSSAKDVVSGGESVPMAVVQQLAAGTSPIRVWREHRGLSLRALGGKAGISAALLSEIETGKKGGSVHTLAALARVLSVTLDDLVPWPQD